MLKKNTQNKNSFDNSKFTLNGLNFSVHFRFDPLHQRDERQHSPTGRLAVRKDHQHQLGGRVQVPDHHASPHGLRQRGECRPTAAEH